MQDEYSDLIKRMVLEQLIQRGIRGKDVLEAFLAVPRHRFVPIDKADDAYDDNPVSIGAGQTISQPYMVALMTEQADIIPGQKVLEIGSGSGYQAAILAHMGARVFGVERILDLSQRAQVILDALGYTVKIIHADGTLGLDQEAPFDRIIVSAAAPALASHWIEQLKPAGRLIVPLGNLLQQTLTLVEKAQDGRVTQRDICGCTFVPLLGRYGYREES